MLQISFQSGPEYALLYSPQYGVEPLVTGVEIRCYL